MLQTRYSLDKHQAESGGGEKLVETQGYIPADVQIEQLIGAGVRLDNYRKEAYDFGPGEEVPDDFVDPTRKKGIDLAEVSAIARVVRSNMQESLKIAKKEAGESKQGDGTSPVNPEAGKADGKASGSDAGEPHGK